VAGKAAGVAANDRQRGRTVDDARAAAVARPAQGEPTASLSELLARDPVVREVSRIALAYEEAAGRSAYGALLASDLAETLKSPAGVRDFALGCDLGLKVGGAAWAWRQIELMRMPARLVAWLFEPGGLERARAAAAATEEALGDMTTLVMEGGRARAALRFLRSYDRYLAAMHDLLGIGPGSAEDVGGAVFVLRGVLETLMDDDGSLTLRLLTLLASIDGHVSSRLHEQIHAAPTAYEKGFLLGEPCGEAAMEIVLFVLFWESSIERAGPQQSRALLARQTARANPRLWLWLRRSLRRPLLGSPVEVEVVSEAQKLLTGPAEAGALPKARQVPLLDVPTAQRVTPLPPTPAPLSAKPSPIVDMVLVDDVWVPVEQQATSGGGTAPPAAPMVGGQPGALATTEAAALARSGEPAALARSDPAALARAGESTALAVGRGQASPMPAGGDVAAALPAGSEPPRLPGGVSRARLAAPRGRPLLGPGEAPLYGHGAQLPPPATIDQLADNPLAPYTPAGAKLASAQPLAPLAEAKVLVVATPAKQAATLTIGEQLADAMSASLRQQLEWADRALLGPLPAKTQAAIDAAEALLQNQTLSVPKVASALRRLWTAKAAELGGNLALYERIAKPLYQRIAGRVLPYRQMKRLCAVWNSLSRFLFDDPDGLELHAHHAPFEARAREAFPKPAAKLGWFTDLDMPTIAVHYEWHIRTPRTLWPALSLPPPEATSLTWELFRQVDLTKTSSLRAAYVLYRNFYRSPVTERSTGTIWLYLESTLDEIGLKLGYTRQAMKALDAATDAKTTSTLEGPKKKKQ
jgi:hypothetical protein